jgi:hypothetical protein
MPLLQIAAKLCMRLTALRVMAPMPEALCGVSIWCVRSAYGLILLGATGFFFGERAQDFSHGWADWRLKIGVSDTAGQLFFVADKNKLGPNGAGAFVALSNDDGVTWQKRQLPGMVTVGYTTATQAPNG